jgi:hypothetical protein
LYTEEVGSAVSLATKFCIVVIYFLLFEKKKIRNEIFWVTFTRRLFWAVADKQILKLDFGKVLITSHHLLLFFFFGMLTSWY